MPARASTQSSVAKSVGSISVSGWLFDIYHLEDQIYLCLLDDEGKFYLCRDHFHPIIYARAPESVLKKLVHRLHEMEGLHETPVYVKRKLFYENRLVDVLSISISRPSILRRIRSRLYAMYGRMDLFHTDFEVPTGYMQQKGIFPLCRLKAVLHPLGSGSCADQGNRKADADPVSEKGSKKHLSSVKDTSYALPPLYNLERVQATDDIYDLDFKLPPVRILRLNLNYGHRLTYQKLLSGSSHRRFNMPDQRIQLECNGTRLELPTILKPEHLHELNQFLFQTDPDIILSAYGDQVLFPLLFQFFQKYSIMPLLDRDATPGARRKIVTEGSSYNTYGSWIFRAPSYPLFGRWHIDSANSFVFKEAQLMGIVELSRMSRIPVQKLSRSSTGAALTAIESEVALAKNYLVPWQKSALEQPRTVMELLEADKGGLVFVPRANGILENVAQIDFSQMYPSIMSIHNVSPETINCMCCENDETDHVPEIGFRICNKRRGIVSDALAHILERRKHYKLRIKELKSSIQGRSKDEMESLEKERDVYDHRQSSLKWMLVTSFGYLGYRNAKFGKIESHEAVTAFGRDKLLTAKEIAEDADYSVIHGITDCLFLGIPEQNKESHCLEKGKPGSKLGEERSNGQHPEERPGRESRQSEPLRQSQEKDLQDLCLRIGKATGIEMSLEGIYDWVIFLPSKTKEGIAVVNRYFGRFRDGSLRVRGISVRRKDRPSWIKNVQEEFLERMSECSSAAELKTMHPRMERIYYEFKESLERREIPWTDLLLRRTVSKGLDDYSVDGPAPAALRELQPYGIQIQAGEKIKYIVLEKTEPHASRYMSEEMAFQRFGLHPEKQPAYDIAYYSQLLRDAFEEVWQYAAPEGYFHRKDIRQQDLPGLGKHGFG